MREGTPPTERDLRAIEDNMASHMDKKCQWRRAAMLDAHGLDATPKRRGRRA